MDERTDIGALLDFRLFAEHVVELHIVAGRVSISCVLGPMMQFLPITVFPRRMVPGRMRVSAPIVTSAR